MTRCEAGYHDWADDRYGVVLPIDPPIIITRLTCNLCGKRIQLNNRSGKIIKVDEL